MEQPTTADAAPVQHIGTRQPCRECPFREDGIRHLGYRADDIADAICDGRRFACHMTLETGDDGLTTENGAACIGALKSMMDMEGVLPIKEFIAVQHRV